MYGMLPPGAMYPGFGGPTFMPLPTPMAGTAYASGEVDYEQMQTDMLLFQIQEYKKYLMHSFSHLDQLQRSRTTKTILSQYEETDEPESANLLPESNQGLLNTTIEEEPSTNNMTN